MARIEIATQGWGWVMRDGDPVSGAVVQIKSEDGLSNATHWSALTGGTSSTGTITTDSQGAIRRFIDGGVYRVVVNGVDSGQVDTVSGSVAIGLAAVKAQWPINFRDRGADYLGSTDASPLLAELLAEGPVYVPAGTYKWTSVSEMPSGSRLELDDDALFLGTAAPSASYTMLRNVGWASSTPASDIQIKGGRLRRETVLAGDEGSYSNLINLRRVDKAKVVGVTLEGNEGGVQVEGCTRFKILDCYGYRQSDLSVRVNWSGSDGPGGPSAQLGLVEGCWSVEAGYQYGSGTVVPSGIPIGSAFICTQSDVTFRGCGSVDSVANGFESGNGLTGVVIEGHTLMVLTAGRSANMLIANGSDIDVSGVKTIYRAAGGAARIYVIGDVTGTQLQRNIRISNCSGVNSTTDEIDGINVGRYSAHVSIADCHYDNLRLFAGGTAVSDVRMSDCSVRNARRSGIQFQAGERLSGRNLRVIDCGQLGSGDAKQRAGFVFDTLGADCEFTDLLAYDTRTAGARTQTYGFYHAHSANVIWDNCVARNNLTGELATDFAPVLVPRVAHRFAVTTALRPSAVTAGAGANLFDTTLSKPIWSDGAAWRDAAGTAV